VGKFGKTKGGKKATGATPPRPYPLWDDLKGCYVVDLKAVPCNGNDRNRLANTIDALDKVSLAHTSGLQIIVHPKRVNDRLCYDMVLREKIANATNEWFDDLYPTAPTPKQG
jgi:hypothetical protein